MLFEVMSRITLAALPKYHNFYNVILFMRDVPATGRAVPHDLTLLSMADLISLLGVRRTTIWKLRQQPDFPKPLGLTRTLSWRAVDIQHWLEQRLTQAGNTPAAPSVRQLTEQLPLF